MKCPRVICLHCSGIPPGNLVVCSHSPFWFFIISCVSESVPTLSSQTSFPLMLTTWVISSCHRTLNTINMLLTFKCISLSQTYSPISSLIYPTPYLTFSLAFLIDSTKFTFPNQTSNVPPYTSSL